MLFALIARTRCGSAKCVPFISTPVALVPRLQPQLPPGFQGPAYERSGWCFVEACATTSLRISHVKHGMCLAGAVGFFRWTQSSVCLMFCFHVKACISSAIKPSHRRLDLSLLDDHNVLSACMKGRLPPMTPDRVEFELVNNKEFTNKSDVNKVAKLYKNFFDIVSSSVTSLDVMDLAMPKGGVTRSTGKLHSRRL